MPDRPLGVLHPVELSLDDVCRAAGVALPPKRRTSDLTDDEIESALAAAFPETEECPEPEYWEVYEGERGDE